MEMRGTKKGGKRGIAVLERGICVAEPWFTYLNNNNTTRGISCFKEYVHFNEHGRCVNATSVHEQPKLRY